MTDKRDDTTDIIKDHEPHDAGGQEQHGLMHRELVALSQQLDRQYLSLSKEVRDMRHSFEATQKDLYKALTATTVIEGQIRELASSDAQTDEEVELLVARVIKLESADEARKEVDAERDKLAQPQQYGIVTTTIIVSIVGLLSSSFAAWILIHWASDIVKRGAP